MRFSQLRNRVSRRAPKYAFAVASVAAIAVTMVGGVSPASAVGPSGKPVTEGFTSTLGCNTININGGEVRTYVEAYTPNHGNILRGAKFWVTYQIHADSKPKQWPLGANAGVFDTNGNGALSNGPMTFRAPTNTTMAGAPQIYTPNRGEYATPHVLPGEEHVYGTDQTRPIYPGKYSTGAAITGGTPTTWTVNVDGDSNPNGSYNDGFYFEIRFPVKVNNNPGTITVLPFTGFSGTDGTDVDIYAPFEHQYDAYSCTPWQFGLPAFITGLGFTIAW